MNDWKKPDQKPRDMQLVMIRYYPWNNTSNAVARMLAVYDAEADEWLGLSLEGGTTWPPIEWHPINTDPAP